MNEENKILSDLPAYEVPTPPSPAAVQPASNEIMSREELNVMYAEVKKTLKTCSKNQLIQYVCALLIEKYILTHQLQALGGRRIKGPNESLISKFTSFFKR